VIINMSGPDPVPGVINFPDLIPYTGTPSDEHIGDDVVVTGCGEGTSITVCGSVDD